MAKRTKKSKSRKAHKASRKASRKFSPKQIAAQKKFAAMARAGSFKKASAPKVRKAKRRGKRAGRRIVRHVASVRGHVVAIHKVKRGKVAKFRARRAKGRGMRIKVNPSEISLLGGITKFIPNAKSVMGGGVKGYAFAALGMGGSIFAGTLMARVTTPLVAKFAPGLVSNPIGARVLGAANYYLTGYLLARFIPGIDARTRKAILVGGAVAALAEVVSPGMVRTQLSKLPVIGPVFGERLSGLADDLSGYVATMSGIGEGHRWDDATETRNLNGYTALSGLAEGYEDQMVSAGETDDGTPE